MTRSAVPRWGRGLVHDRRRPSPPLLGQRCTTCGTYVFPRADVGCPNPHCRGMEFDDVRSSRRGKVWSYTDACYQPPPPFIVPAGEHEPFAIAAVELEEEGLVVLGQVVRRRRSTTSRWATRSSW